jgi:hypothetical protein
MATTTVVGGTGNDTIKGGAAAGTVAAKGNPYAIDPYASKDEAGLLTSATSQTSEAPVKTYDFTKADTASTYTAADQKASTYTPATIGSANTYDASKATATDWDVATNQTVQGQLEGILEKESPLMQQAKTQALQQMNARGLLSSSMALGAGQEALIKQALPIAQADAAMYGAAGRFNAETANTLASFNAAQANAAAQFGANAKNVIAAADQAAKNEAAKFGATAENVAAAANAAAKNEAAKFGASAQNTIALANATAANEAAKFNASSENVSAIEFAKNVNANVAAMMDQSIRVALANADAATKIELQTIDATTRKDLANIEANYKNQMQASASAGEIFQQVTKNISDILANPDLSAFATKDGKAPTTDKKNWPSNAVTLRNGKLYDADNIEIVSPKQNAVNIQKGYLDNSLNILSATSAIPGLKDLITFGTGTTAATNESTTPAANTGTTPAANTGTTPAANTGTKPAANTGTTPAANTGTKPAANTGTTPAANTGKTPVERPLEGRPEGSPGPNYPNIPRSQGGVPDTVSTPYGKVSTGVAKAFGNQLNAALASGAVTPIKGTATKQTPPPEEKKPFDKTSQYGGIGNTKTLKELNAEQKGGSKSGGKKN